MISPHPPRLLQDIRAAEFERSHVPPSGQCLDSTLTGHIVISHDILHQLWYLRLRLSQTDRQWVGRCKIWFRLNLFTAGAD